MSAEAAQAPPLLRVVRGDPTEAELAALVAVVAARSAAPATPEGRPTPSRWAAVRPRPVLRHGPGAWQASARTR